MDQYSLIGTAIMFQMVLSAFTFGYVGWGASKRALPITALFAYVCAFFTAGLAGVTGQLVFG